MVAVDADGLESSRAMSVFVFRYTSVFEISPCKLVHSLFLSGGLQWSLCLLKIDLNLLLGLCATSLQTLNKL